MRKLLFLAGFLLFWVVPFQLVHAADQATKVIPVVVAKVTRMNIPKEVEALGSLEALNIVTISPEVAGRVTKIFFKDGQKIAKGMPIIQLNNEQDKAAYQAAVSALNLSKVKYKRSKLVFESAGAISRQDLDQLQADVESKEAAVKTALATLNQKELLAPFDGILGSFQVQVGDYVNAGEKLVKLVNRKQLRAIFVIPEKYVPELKLNQQVVATTNAYPKMKFLGTVTFISPSVDLATRSVEVQAAINNQKDLLSPGMFVEIVQTVGIDKNALVVPDDAVEASVKGYTVYVVQNNKVKQTQVTLGTHVRNLVQITKGLKFGDVVVIAGQQKLQDGSIVTIKSK